MNGRTIFVITRVQSICYCPGDYNKPGLIHRLFPLLYAYNSKQNVVSHNKSHNKWLQIVRGIIDYFAVIKQNVISYKDRNEVSDWTEGDTYVFDEFNKGLFVFMP